MCATYEYLDVWFKPVHVTTKLKDMPQEPHKSKRTGKAPVTYGLMNKSIMQRPHFTCKPCRISSCVRMKPQPYKRQCQVTMLHSYVFRVQFPQDENKMWKLV